MEKAKNIDRNFKKNDLLMLSQAQTVNDIFDLDKVAFVARFTGLADPFAVNWQAAIDVAHTIPTNEEVLNELQLLTADVEAEMKTARNHYQTMLTYLRLAYPANVAVLALFGHEQYETSSYNQLRMIELMELAHSKANVAPYKVQLIQKGFTQTDITLLNTIKINLQNKNKAQESFKASRLLLTQNRIVGLNTVWDSWNFVHDAAQIVFMGNQAKLKQYLLYPEAGGNTPPNTTAFLTMVTDQTLISTVNIAIKALSGKVKITWGDGNIEEVLMDNTLLNTTHIYATANTYTIVVDGDADTVTEFFAMNSHITQAQVSDKLVNLDILNFLNNTLIAFNLPDTLNKLRIIVFNNNQLDVGTVNNLLIITNNYNTVVIGSSISLSFGTNAPPTGNGILAKAALVSRGWGVNTN